MKLKMKLPCLLYNIKYEFKKQKDLGELETIILSILIWNYQDNLEKNLLSFVCQSLALEELKWKEFVSTIIKDKLLDFKIIEKQDRDIEIDKLLVGDVIIHEKIKENFSRDIFLGFESGERNISTSILKPLISDWQPWYESKSNNYDDFILRKEYDGKLAYDIQKINETIDDLIHEFGDEQTRSNEILHKVFFNKDTLNLALVPSKKENFTILLKENEIVNDDKKFYNLFNFYKKYNMISYFNEQIVSHFTSLLNEIPETNQITKYLELNQYNDVIQKYKNKNQHIDFIVFNKEFWVVGKIKTKIKIFDQKIEIPLIVLRKKEFKNFDKFVINNYKNVNLLDFYNLFKEEERDVFKKVILENYLEIFLNNIRWYENFVISWFSDIKEINSFWFWNELDIQKFKKIFGNMQKKDIEKTIKSIKMIDTKFDSISKINEKLDFFYNSHNFSLKIFNLSKNCDWINDFYLKEQKYEALLKSDKLKEIQAYIVELDKTNKSIMPQQIKISYLSWSRALKEKENQLVKNNDNDIIDKFLDILDKEIKGKLDEWLRSKTGVHDKSVNVFSLIEKIKDKKSKNKLHKLRIFRNEYAHNSNEELRNKLKSLTSKELKEQYDNLIELKKVIKEEK